MKLSVPFEDNILPQKYAKYATETVGHSAVLSFPFDILDIPKGTKSVAWTLVDFDSIPVCGFAYIHWVVANVAVSEEKLAVAEDFSRQSHQQLRGSNSLVSKFLSDKFPEVHQSYIGPYPPDKDHRYTLTVYALDEMLELQEGFFPE